jgi:hypothetical protein
VFFPGLASNCNPPLFFSFWWGCWLNLDLAHARQGHYHWAIPPNPYGYLKKISLPFRDTQIILTMQYNVWDVLINIMIGNTGIWEEV